MRHFLKAVKEVRRALVALGADPACEVYAGEPADCWGFWAPSFGIVVNPKLRGRALWIVLLHEFGHALGLDHKRSGIMHCRPLRGGVDLRAPTAKQKREWAEEIARAAALTRARNRYAARLV